MTPDAIARLREQVRRLEHRNLSSSIIRMLSTGLYPVDNHLGGGLRTAGLHDILIPDFLEIGASLAVLLPLLGRSGLPVFWLSTMPSQLYGWGLAQTGLAPQNLIYVESDKTNLMAVTEDLLRGPERALVVVADSHEPSLREVRRLNLAAESSGNTGFFLRPVAPLRMLGKDPCACATRWQITSAPSAPFFLPGLAMPLPGPRRVSLSLLRMRGGRPAHWIFDCPDHAPFSRPMDALLAHRAPPTLAAESLSCRETACRACV